MALWVCAGCTAAYAVGAPRCPQCGATDRVEEGEAVPKITVHGGASNAAATEEEPSAGSSSTTSSPQAPSSQPPSKSGRRSRARTTGSRSGVDPTDSSTAPATAGDPTAPTTD